MIDRDDTQGQMIRYQEEREREKTAPPMGGEQVALPLTGIMGMCIIRLAAS